MLAEALKANSRLDTREGSLVWLGSAPAAVELQNLYIALQSVLDETFADTASRDYLILRAKERGISPLPATPAVLEMEATPKTLDIPLGTRFSIGSLNYSVTKNSGGGKFGLTCETAGEAGNDYSGDIIPIEYVAGLEACKVTALLVPGEDEEDTEIFRKRYLDSLNSQAFGGNRADYLEKINAIPGVGGVKVYRVWNDDIKPSTLVPPTGTTEWIAGLTGVSADIKSWLTAVNAAGANNKLTVGGTVRIVIIDSTFGVPSSTLVGQVQTAVDPTQNSGEGYGLAPIGHVVKVEGVGSEAISLSFTLTFQSGWTWNDVKDYVEATVNGYFGELAKTWADSGEPLVVRVSQIESRILGVAGVLDITGTKINGKAANHTLAADKIPVLGTITEGA